MGGWGVGGGVCVFCVVGVGGGGGFADAVGGGDVFLIGF